jgi:hypothetical protein
MKSMMMHQRRSEACISSYIILFLVFRVEMGFMLDLISGSFWLVWNSFSYVMNFWYFQLCPWIIFISEVRNIRLISPICCETL